MTTLQAIVKKAKAIKKAHPRKFAKWTDYIKEASKHVKPAKKKKVSGLVGVKRSGNKTDVLYTRAKPAKKTTTKQGALFGVTSIKSVLKGKLATAEKALKKIQQDQKAIPQIKKVITKLKRAIK